MQRLLWQSGAAAAAVVLVRIRGLRIREGVMRGMRKRRKGFSCVWWPMPTPVAPQPGAAAAAVVVASSNTRSFQSLMIPSSDRKATRIPLYCAVY